MKHTRLREKPGDISKRPQDLDIFFLSVTLVDTLIFSLPSFLTRATFRSQKYFTSPRIEHALLVGGTNRGPVISLLQSSCDVVVGTPGRILDFMEKGLLDNSAVRLLVRE